MAEKKCVGLIAFTVLPNKGLVAILQRRGEFNHEKMKPESYPGGFQLTVWGGVNENESFSQALQREVFEEAGRLWEMSLFEVEHEIKTLLKSDDSAHIVAWLANSCELEDLQLSASTGGIRLITEDQIDAIRDLKSFDKNEGVTDSRITAMFLDAKELLRNGFRWAKIV